MSSKRKTKKRPAPPAPAAAPEPPEPKPCEMCKGERYLLRVSSGTQETHRIRCPCTYDNLPIAVVFQPEKSGCGIAAVAMVAEKTYAEVRQRCNMAHDFTVDGMGQYEMEDLLIHYGFSYQIITKNHPRLGSAREVWPPAPWTELAIAQVRNLSNSGYHYVVLLKDGRVLDPWYGVIQGLHRYPDVLCVHGVFKHG
jgi:hypothetical protein